MQNNNKMQQLYDYINDFRKQNGYPPTVREMCVAINVKSTSTIAYYINKMEQRGMIRKCPNKNRALEITKVEKEMTKIPIVGTVTAGVPILAVEECEDYLMVSPDIFRGDNLFVLNVTGESMINAGIYNGDRVVVRQLSMARDGDIVVAMIDGCATIKRFFKEDGRYRLQPENDTMSPIITDHVDILGRVIGLIRKIY